MCLCFMLNFPFFLHCKYRDNKWDYQIFLIPILIFFALGKADDVLPVLLFQNRADTHLSEWLQATFFISELRL